MSSSAGVLTMLTAKAMSKHSTKIRGPDMKQSETYILHRVNGVSSSPAKSFRSDLFHLLQSQLT